ncbi:hypothetical protein [Ferrovibrio sp.]|uniref:hypothetical protein n=1 Tax=Ferrovibrio sp. TaxID=1917215 RepID=UPI0035B29105
MSARFALGALVGLPAALALWFGAAQAAEPRPDPPGQYRIIGPDGAPGQSDCIGQPYSALCAVETLLACFARRDEGLCQRVWAAAPAGALFGTEQRRQAYWWSYRVEAVRPVAHGGYEIAIAGRHCGLLTEPPLCRSTPAPPTVYTALPYRGSLWRVTEWHADNPR